jgi:predicted regulator of Ras-like GTPase activity (Roadblock/LC7/MglB family)
MMEAFTDAVEKLSRIRGVRGALIVEKASAVPVVAELSEGVNGTAVAALAASMFRRTAQASDAARFGGLSTLQLDADGGHVVVVDAGELVLVVVAERDAQLGLVRLEAVRTGKALG